MAEVAVHLHVWRRLAGAKIRSGWDDSRRNYLEVAQALQEAGCTALAIHPRTKNAYISVMRGTGADAKPVLLRVDGAGAIEPIAVEKL